VIKKITKGKAFIKFFDIDKGRLVYVDPSVIYLIEEIALRNRGRAGEAGSKVCRKLYLNTLNNSCNSIFVEATADEVMKLRGFITDYEKNLHGPGGGGEGLVEETKTRKKG